MAEDFRKRLDTDPDFVNLPRFDNSLKKLLAKHPDGVSDKTIAQALMIDEDDVESTYKSIILKLRRAVKAQ